MNVREIILKVEFGSHLYGTTVPESDQDYKIIYLPDADRILLQRSPRTSNCNSTGDPGSKNLATDVDVESFPLHGYMKQLCSGQTVALDMLFVPKAQQIIQSAIFDELYADRERLLSRRITAYVGYCRKQASKYGIKGSRMAAARDVLEFLKGLRIGNIGRAMRLGERSDKIEAFIAEYDNEFVEIIPGKTGLLPSAAVPHLSVCGRKAPMTSRISHAIEVYQKLYDDYGDRTRAAMLGQGIDWKAMMHATRVLSQSEELLATGHITFPRPDASLLLMIRRGEIKYPIVAAGIEDGIARLDRLADESNLRDEPDLGFADEFVAHAYAQVVKAAY